MDYPHYVQPLSALKDHTFVGSYMPEAEIEKLKSIFPNGCNGDSINEYIVINGAELVDSIYQKTKGGSKERIEVFNLINKIKEDNKLLLWDLRQFFYNGYWLIFDDKLNLSQLEKWHDEFSLDNLVKNNLSPDTISLPNIPYNYHEIYREILRREYLNDL